MRKKRKPWPRWAKTARNLLLAALLGLMVWNMLGQPAPYEAEIRRWERQCLVPETEHSLAIPRGVWSGARLDWTEGAAVVSMPVQARGFTRARCQTFRLTEGANLVAIPCTAAIVDGTSNYVHFAVYAAVFPPEGGETALLTLRNDGGDVAATAQGQKEEGAFLFYAEREPDEDGSLPDLGLCSHTVEFFGKNGESVGKIAG